MSNQQRDKFTERQESVSEERKDQAHRNQKHAYLSRHASRLNGRPEFNWKSHD